MDSQSVLAASGKIFIYAVLRAYGDTRYELQTLLGIAIVLGKASVAGKYPDNVLQPLTDGGLYRKVTKPW